MFHTRSSLHRRAYQHKTCNIIETMYVSRIHLHTHVYTLTSLSFFFSLCCRLTEALVKANDHFLLPGKDRCVQSNCVHFLSTLTVPFHHCSLVKMSEAIYDPHAYTRLTDHVVQQILMSSDPNLEEVGSVQNMLCVLNFYTDGAHALLCVYTV